ncbi:penicillin acylase family protein [Niveibacterium sp.]|uniref:penicillin acylase family protein n=1 Tax=Niveibacterium sp. TaxID=2017444 RepID=UPI0035B363F4
MQNTTASAAGRFTFRTMLAGMAAAMLAACGSNDPSRTANGSGGNGYAAEIRYTSFGVPHIKADNWKGAGYGYGYAFATDHVCLFSQEVVTLHGERARYFGEKDSSGNAITYLGQLGGFIGNLESDFFYKSYMTPDVADRMKAASSADVRDLVAGFVAGYNRYLRDTGANGLPAECKNANWVQPIAEADAYFRMHQAAMTGSSLAFITQIASAQPPASARITQARVTPATAQQLQQSEMLKALHVFKDGVIGSNGYGLGREVTASGKGIVLGNPHFPWWGVLRLHQLHITVAGQYDVYGATLLGAPLPLIGFNKDVAWTHTFSTDQRFTLFQLKLDPADPKRYMVGTESRAMTATRVQVQALQADGSMATRERTMYSTEYGPIATDSLFTWTTSTAYAFKDANRENFRLMDQVLLNGKATSAASLREALATYSEMPWVNTIGADKDGSALYANYSVAANVTDAQLASCVGTGLPQLALAVEGVAILNGNDASCNWSGHVPSAQRPYVLRTDYAMNANDSHWWPNQNVRLAGYPKIIATGPDAEGVEQGERTRAGIAQILDRVSGADGLPGTLFTVASLQEVYKAGRFYKPERWLGEFVTACLASARTDLTAACTVLRDWNRKEQLDAKGALLFREFYARMNEMKDASLWRVPYDPADPLNTPNGFNPANTTAYDKLAETVAYFGTQGFALDETPGARQVITRNGKPLVIPGGRYTFNNWRGQLANGKYGDPAYGNSYMQFVTFDDKGPVAEGMLTYSQSTHAFSEHYADLTELYAQRQWAKLPYTEAQITADPNLRTLKISE